MGDVRKILKEKAKKIRESLEGASKPKHTPGPWRIDKVIKTRYDSDTGAKLKDEIFLFIYPDDAKKEHFNIALVNTYATPEAEANAALIAAAPEMLEALKAVAVTDALHGMKTSGMDIMSLVTNAIAKAEGRE